MYAHQIAILDILASFNWERPLYFINAGTLINMFGGDDIERHIIYEGAVSKLVPNKSQNIKY